MRAYPPEHAGQRQIFHDDLEGLFVFALLDHLDIALNIEAAGTGQAAGGLVCFLYGIRSGNGLGIFFKGGFFSCQTFIIFARKIHRADRGTLATAGTLGKINIAWVLTNPGFEVSRFTFKF